MKFCQVLHQIGALRQRYNGVPEGHEELNSDEWLKGFLMLSILEEVRPHERGIASDPLKQCNTALKGRSFRRRVKISTVSFSASRV